MVLWYISILLYLFRHVKLNMAIVQKALLRKMIIPEWEEFATLVRGIYRDEQKNSVGEVRQWSRLSQTVVCRLSEYGVHVKIHL